MHYVLLFTSLSFGALAQPGGLDVIQGPDVVVAGQNYDFAYDHSVIMLSHSWYVSNGSVISESVVGSRYEATITFSNPGSATIYLEDENETVIAYKTVTVESGCTAPSNPVVTFSLDPSTCSPRALSYTGTPPAGVTWFWQTSVSGTSVANSTNSYSVTANGTYFVRARNNTTQCWSSGTPPSYAVTIATPPSMPSAPSVSSNSCGAKTITRGSPPSGVTWYWQGENSLGTSTTSSASTYTANFSSTYYLRARNNSTGCWSTARSISITINPAQPQATVSPGTCGTITITRGTPSGSDVWYWQGTTALGTSTTNFASTYQVTTSGTYYLRARTSSGCWSPTSTPFVIVTNPLPATPPAFTVSSNTCGPKTLTRSAPPGGFTYYWQSFSYGTNMDPAAAASTWLLATNGTTNFYLRSRNNSTGCWSTERTVAVTVDNPDNPVDKQHTFCEWETMNLTTTTTLNNPITQYATWFEPATNDLKTGASIIVNKYAGVHTYQVRNKSLQSCESAGYGTVVLTVPVNCDDRLNWNQTTSYTLDNALNPVPYSSARVYSDGLGNPLQNQSKDFVHNAIMASQAVYDRNNKPVLNTLPAPIPGTQFSYKAKFITNTSNAMYSKNDFDASVGSGTYDNPSPVETNQPGTLGWYYSSHNTTEPLTPTTAYPYSRTWTEDNPDPKISKTVGPGDVKRMGSNKEIETSREKFLSGELEHYLSLGYAHFGTQYSAIHNSVRDIQASSATKSKFAPKESSNVTEISIDLIMVSSSQTSGLPGVYPIDGTITVVPGKTYSFSVRGYSGSTNLASLYVTTAAGVSIGQSSPTLPSGASNIEWVTTSFKVPAGVTGIKAGVVWNTPAVSSVMVINQVRLNELKNDVELGYKTIITDPNEKQSVGFTDVDGKLLATATKNGSAYGDWSYSYYNAIGQVIATVEPNGVNLSSSALPTFLLLYKYDHVGNVIETTSPDEGVSQFVYDFDGNIRFSQNHEQRTASPKRFSYVNYDNLGRLIESGEYSMSGSGYYVFEPQSTTAPILNSVLNLVNNKGFAGVTRRKNNSTAARYSDTTFLEYDVQAQDFITDTLHASQAYTFGQITNTRNANGTTWYSYDEFGQLVWTKQSINGLGIKTIDYEYDFLGNVTKVVYQRGQADDFYYQYLYDANQRLSEVKTSLNDTSYSLRARYHYYLHGPLKRIELGDNVQGIDYVYAIDGSLKSINDASLTNDPGEDGTNGFATDVFGQTLHYYTNDYVGAGHTGSVQSFSGYSDQYGGALKGISWHSPTDNNIQPRSYAFTYDNKYQLQESKFGNFSSGAFAADPLDKYKESVPSYDKNGNIQSLQRNGLDGSTIGNYSYLYESGTNKLDKVNHNGSVLVDYSYNPIGQMIRQQEGSDVMDLSYNVHGITREVRNATNQLIVTFAYDDRGDLSKRTDYNNGTATKYTFYVRDASGNSLAIYEQILPSVVPVLKEVPVYGIGRVAVYRPNLNAYFYEIGDHQGSVRAVIGTQDTNVYMATMETENFTEEESIFKNIAATRAVSTAANNTLNGNEVARLNHLKPAGPAISLKVSPGDKLDISTWAYYEAGSDYDNALGASPTIAAIAAAFGGVSGAPGEPGQIFTALNNALGSGVGMLGLGGTDDETLPGAYVCYLVFDVNQNFTGQGGYTRVTENGNMAKEQIVIPQVTIEHPGYVYVFVYNRSDSDDFVYFDDFEVTHEHSLIVAGADYYPFGLTMEGREITQEDYRWGYQGLYAEKDSITGWNQFELRMYDARFGRWLSPDPYGQFYSPYLGMGNMPNMGTDPDGGYSDPVVFFHTLPAFVVHSSGLSYMLLQSLPALLTPAVNSIVRFEADGSSTYWSKANAWANYNAQTGDIYSFEGSDWGYQGNTSNMQNEYAQTRMAFASDGSEFIADAASYAVPTGAVVGAVGKPLLKLGQKVFTRIVTKVAPKVIAKGAPTIVGEGMKRVSMEAVKHPGAVILNNMPTFSGSSHQITSQIMTYNRQWILQQMRSGAPIIDLGVDVTRKVPSIFYQMEKNMMKNYLKLHPGAF